MTGLSWDGKPPGTLADLSGQTSFSFGLAAFSAGVYRVTWLGGITDWRGLTTIGAGDQVMFDPGYVAVGTQRTFTMTKDWAMWVTTPDLQHAESTGVQWAFTSTEPQQWSWGLEDILYGFCDCDYQDAYGSLARIGDVPAPPSLTLSESMPLPAPPTPHIPPTSTLTTAFEPGGTDDALTAVPEPGTMALVTIGLAGLGARLRLRRR